MLNLNIRYDDIYPFLGGIAIGSELFPSLNLSYWEPDYPKNLTINQINYRKRLYLDTILNRSILVLITWGMFLKLLYPLSPLVTIIVGLSILVSFMSRYNFKTMRKFSSLMGFYLIALLLISFLLYERFQDELVLLGPLLILIGKYLINQSRNKTDQENIDLLGRFFFGVGFTLLVISLKAIRTL
jgi:hypothetical protein